MDLDLLDLLFQALWKTELKIVSGVNALLQIMEGGKMSFLIKRDIHFAW